MARRGLLVAVEGINGAGKSTLIGDMVEYLRELNCESSVYKFPNRQGVCGDKIDRYLKGDNSVFKTKYDRFDAFARNKQADIDNINHDLANSRIVFCDRYIMSGVAYYIPEDATIPVISAYYNVLSHFDNEMPVPDLTLLIDGDHLMKRGDALERFHNKRNSQMVDNFQVLLAIDQAMNGTSYKIVCNRYGDSMSIARECVNQFMFAI